MPRTPKLEKLRQQQADLRAQIKDAEKAEKRKEAERHLLRCTIIGSALVDAMRDDETLAAQLEPIINKRVVKVKERRMIGLPPLKDERPTGDTEQ